MRGGKADKTSDKDRDKEHSRGEKHREGVFFPNRTPPVGFFSFAAAEEKHGERREYQKRNRVLNRDQSVPAELRSERRSGKRGRQEDTHPRQPGRLRRRVCAASGEKESAADARQDERERRTVFRDRHCGGAKNETGSAEKASVVPNYVGQKTEQRGKPEREGGCKEYVLPVFIRFRIGDEPAEDEPAGEPRKRVSGKIGNERGFHLAACFR